MLKITHRYMSGGTTHEHIEQVYVVDTSTNSGSWWRVRPTAVDHLMLGGKLYVVEVKPVEVGVRENSRGLRYIQTSADGVWQNNLLNLPEGYPM